MKLAGTQIQSKPLRLRWVAISTGAVLLLAALLQMFGEGAWGPLDYVLAGILVIGAGLAYEILASRVGTLRQRAIIAVIVFVVLFSVWAEISVGIFGTPFAGN